MAIGGSGLDAEAPQTQGAERAARSARSATDVKEATVVVIGHTSVGKTLMFWDMEDSVFRGRHGYQLGQGVSLRRKVFGEVMTAYGVDDTPTMTPTERVTANHFDLSLRPLQPKGEGYVATDHSERYMLHVYDTRGEDSRLPEDQDLENQEASERQKQIANADGIVMAISPYRTWDAKYFRKNAGEMWALLQRSREAGGRKPSQIVIVLTMFDAVLAQFRRYAALIALDAEMVLDVMARHLRPLRNEIERLRPPDYDEDIDLRFIASSSFGFHPQYGCSNLDLANWSGQFAGVDLPRPLADWSSGVEKRPRYPYMAADPFIFAATGHKNSFLFRYEDVHERLQMIMND